MSLLRAPPFHCCGVLLELDELWLQRDERLEVLGDVLFTELLLDEACIFCQKLAMEWFQLDSHGFGLIDQLATILIIPCPSPLVFQWDLFTQCLLSPPAPADDE